METDEDEVTLFALRVVILKLMDIAPNLWLDEGLMEEWAMSNFGVSLDQELTGE